MTLKSRNALWYGMLQAISGHIMETVIDTTKVAINHQ